MLIFLMPQSPDGSPVPSFVFLLLIIVVFYFFMIRPQMKRQKDLKTYREGLSKGDKIVTTGGIYGVVVNVKGEEGIVVLKIADGAKVEFSKAAVQAKIS